MSASSSRDIHLSAVQFAVMRALWRRGEAATSDIAADLAAERGLAPTTVATLLTRLAKRGVVASRRDGRTLTYRALVSEADVRESMVTDLVSTLFRGDALALVTHLVRADDIAPGDLTKIRARLRGSDDE